MTSGRQREVCEGLEQDGGLDGSELKGVVVAGADEWEAGRERHDLN
jgi:hypothetical protein